MKVIIVGGGIIGLYLAWKLSQEGHQVTVFEKKEKIGKEACSGLFSEKILKFIPESKKLIQNEIDSALIHFPRKAVKIKFAQKFLVMARSKLDSLVVELARQRGVKILLNHNVTKQDLVTLQNGFERIIGCDGSLSIVRESLNLPSPKFRLGIKGFIKKDNYSSHVEAWPTKNGFIWKIPRGKEIECGIIDKSKEANLFLKEFLRENNLKLEQIKSALISQGLIIPSHSKVTLCGDSVGLTKPWSGGGVIWGLFAANLLLKNFPDFLKYKNTAERFFLPRIVFSKIATRAFYFLGFNFPWLLPKNIKIESDFLL